MKSSQSKIGTTGKGIGPSYCDKFERCGIRMEDLYAEDFREKLDFISNIKNQIQPILIQKIRYFTLIGKK